MVEVYSEEWSEKVETLMTGFPEEYEFGYQGNPELSGMVTPDMVPNRMKQGYRLLKGKGKNEVVLIWIQDFKKFIIAVNEYKSRYCK